MTSAINRVACSPEYLAAFDALEAGRNVRRASWPDGQYIQRRPDGRISVFRTGAAYAPAWQGPSSAESDAADWQII